MNEQFQLVVRPRVAAEIHRLSAGINANPAGPAATKLAAMLVALDALQFGREAEFKGERLGFSPLHYDLRDCAEIKVPVVQEINRKGKPLGPSHRAIYREFEPPIEGQHPVREVLCLEHRANGLAFAVAASELGRTQSTEVAELRGLRNTVPAIGRNKDPNRPISPIRLPLPSDVAAALSTTINGSRLPGRPAIAPIAAGTCRSRSPLVPREYNL
jgi:hypothetical protein